MRCGWRSRRAATVSGVTLATPLVDNKFMAFLSCPFNTLRSAADTELSSRSKKLSRTRASGKQGAKTKAGALMKLTTALHKFSWVGLAMATSKSAPSLVSSIFHLACTAGFHSDGLPHGIRLASVTILDRKLERDSKVGTVVKVGKTVLGELKAA